MKNIILVLAMLATPAVGYSHGNPIAAVDLAVGTALNDFQVTKSDSELASFEGVKAWPSGSQVKVRVCRLWLSLSVGRLSSLVVTTRFGSLHIFLSSVVI